MDFKKETLEQIYNHSLSILDIANIPPDIETHIEQIAENCYKKKGLYTVLTTLLYYKYLHPEQDIRLHQKQFPGGFSGRSFDTQCVTPVLKKLGLPAMSESGWLTRNLEQPYPYNLNYNGSISGNLRDPFLLTLQYVQNNPDTAYNLLRTLLHSVDKIAKSNQIKINPLENPDNLTIEKIVTALREHFYFRYGTHNGAKLPVLAFHAIYTCLIKEMKRYEDCLLVPLSSLTACDKTNKASGDIEIFKNDHLFESVEIKLNKKITAQILRVVESKIYAWNPQRYYVLSDCPVDEREEEEIISIVNKVASEHGCQIIVNGLLLTIKYYLRLISNLQEFIRIYSSSVETDTELQPIHKKMWNEFINYYLL